MKTTVDVDKAADASGNKVSLLVQASGDRLTEPQNPKQSAPTKFGCDPGNEGSLAQHVDHNPVDEQPSVTVHE